SIAIPLLTLLATYLVDRADSVQAKMKDWAIWALAFFQMPMVYAVERGNNDAAVLPIYALGVFLIARKRWAWAGIAMAAACWMKVYPVIPSFLLLVVLAAAKDRRREEFIPFLKGFTLGGLALLVAFLP